MMRSLPIRPHRSATVYSAQKNCPIERLRPFRLFELLVRGDVREARSPRHTGPRVPAQTHRSRVDFRKIISSLSSARAQTPPSTTTFEMGWLNSFGRFCPSKKISAPAGSSKRGLLNLELITPSDRDEAVLQISRAAGSRRTDRHPRQFGCRSRCSRRNLAAQAARRNQDGSARRCPRPSSASNSG